MRKSSFLLILIFPFFLGTTYIVREGNTEVGRYEENDGHDGEQIIQNEKPEPRPEAPRPAPPVSAVPLPRPGEPQAADFDVANQMKINEASKQSEKKIYKAWVWIAGFTLAMAGAAYWTKRNFGK